MGGEFFKPKKTGVLFNPDDPAPVGTHWPEAEVARGGTMLKEQILRFAPFPGSYTLTFVLVWLFTLVLYMRPAELFPAFFEEYPIQFAKIFATTAPIVFFISRLLGGEKLFHWTPELKGAFAIVALAILLGPFAASFADTRKELEDLYIKVVLIFGLLIAILDSRKRIYQMMSLTVLCGTYIALDVIFKFQAGEVAQKSQRVEGAVGGMFSNPNDLATTFDMLLPLAIVLVIVSKGVWRVLYAACAFIFVWGTIVTFSRGGFLALVAVIGLMVWKFRKRNRLMPVIAVLMISGVLLLAMPGGLGDRLWTIINPSGDASGSAQERKDILKRGVLLFLRHPLTGIGMANFHTFSIKERRAHNAYLEIAAEMGILALIAYLILIFNPLKALWQVEAECVGRRDRASSENYFLTVGLQAILMAYYVNSFFASIQYQWFVYYPVAYAIALRRIHERETQIRAEINAPAHLADFYVGDMDKSTLWQPRQQNGNGYGTEHAPQSLPVNEPAEPPRLLPEKPARGKLFQR